MPCCGGIGGRLTRFGTRELGTSRYADTFAVPSTKPRSNGYRQTRRVYSKLHRKLRHFDPNEPLDETASAERWDAPTKLHVRCFLRNTHQCQRFKMPTNLHPPGRMLMPGRYQLDVLRQRLRHSSCPLLSRRACRYPCVKLGSFWRKKKQFSPRHWLIDAERRPRD